MMRALVHALTEGGGGVQNTLGGARGDSKNPQGILHPRSKYTRAFGMGVPKTGGAKFPMTPAFSLRGEVLLRMRSVNRRVNV